MAKQKKLTDSKRGINYEKRQATKMNAKHAGGPGNPDIIKGKQKIEVKNWKKKVHSSVIQRTYEKGYTGIMSRSGYTQPALELAKTLKIKIHKPK